MTTEGEIRNIKPAA